MRANVTQKWRNHARFFSQLTRNSAEHRQVIALKNGSINAFVSVSEAPTTLEKDLPLSGLTIAVKDNIATKRFPTTCSSAMLRDFISPFDATVVKLLEENGADIIGKTNCDEFGMGSLNVHSVHGPVKNPVCLFQDNGKDEYRSSGGSSGGSAAAVAAGMCDAALGTDTGGSVRLPASYCGVVGLKPSYGLISRWGVVSYADSLDCVGILASTVQTAKRVFDHVSSYDVMDPTCAPREVRDKANQQVQERLRQADGSTSVLNGLRIGIPQEYFPSEMSPEIKENTRSVLKRLKVHGAKIVPISLPSTSYALSSYYVLASAEASSNLARYDGVQYGSYVKPPPETDLTKVSRVYAHTRSANFGLEVQKRILLGTYALSADAFDNYFLQARKVRQLVKNDFNRVFKIPNHFSDSPEHHRDVSDQVDVIIHPSSICPAPLLSEGKSDSSSLGAYLQDVLAVPASLGGLPGLSVPTQSRVSAARGDTTLPVGVSVVGQWGTDSLVLKVGEAIQTICT